MAITAELLTLALAFGAATPACAEAATAAAFVACAAGSGDTRLLFKGGALRQARTRKPGMGELRGGGMHVFAGVVGF